MLTQSMEGKQNLITKYKSYDETIFNHISKSGNFEGALQYNCYTHSPLEITKSKSIVATIKRQWHKWLKEIENAILIVHSLNFGQTLIEYARWRVRRYFLNGHISHYLLKLEKIQILVTKTHDIKIFVKLPI